MIEIAALWVCLKMTCPGGQVMSGMEFYCPVDEVHGSEPYLSITRVDDSCRQVTLVDKLGPETDGNLAPLPDGLEGCVPCGSGNSWCCATPTAKDCTGKACMPEATP